MKNSMLVMAFFLLWTVTAALMAGCRAQAQVDSVLSTQEKVPSASSGEAGPATAGVAVVSQHRPNNIQAPPASFPYTAVDHFGTTKAEKLSGIVYYSPRGSLFAVSDNGQLSEIATDRTLLQQKEIRKKADFEGITYHPTTGMLYVAVEGKEIILEIDPQILTTVREIRIDRMWVGQVRPFPHVK